MEEEDWDEYGFAIIKTIKGQIHGITKSGDELEDDRCHKYTPLNESTEKSWQNILSRWGKYRQSVREDKVRNLILKGVPRKIRPELWHKMLDLKGLQASSSFSYESHVQQMRDEMVKFGVTEYNVQKAEQLLSNVEQNKKSKLDIQAIRQILLDVGRSYPTHKKFFVSNAEGVEGRATLFRILAVYTQYNPVTGYCQGMSYLGGLLLMHFEEKDAFWALVALLERRKYLFGYYDCKLERVQGLAKVFHKVLERKIPKLSKHLDKLGVDPLLFLPKWILCMYTNLPCWDTVLTIWDLIFLDGSVVLFQVALSIMLVCSPQLLKIYDVNQTIPILQKVPHDIANRDSIVSSFKSVNFEGWEIICIQAVIQEEANREGRIDEKKKTPAKNRTSKLRKEKGASFRGSPPTNVLQRLGLALMGRVTSSASKKKVALTCNPDSEKSFECPPRRPLSSVRNCQSPCLSHYCGMRRASNVKKLVGSTASLQLAFRQFQTPMSRHSSPCPVLPRSRFSAIPSPVSPLELHPFPSNSRPRNSRHRTRSTHTRSPHFSVARGQNCRSPSPLELRPLKSQRARRFLTP